AGSFHALHPFVRRPGCESDTHLLTPMDFHFSTSELFQLLEKGHYGVKLSPENMETLITWADLNVPYHPTWISRHGEEKVGAMADRGRELRKRFTGIDDDPEWMPPAPKGRPDYQNPKKTAKQKELQMAEGLPFKAEPGEFQTLENSGSVTVRAVPMHGKTIWVGEAEITNEQFRKFKPDHHSRFIDQQWKDHIYPGYPANEPQMPVVRVSWEEAMAYCKWLSEQTGKKVTLPTAGQWEWACRAGSDQPFYFGDESPAEYANLADEMIGNLAVSGVDPQPVSPNRRSPRNDFVPRDDSFNDGRLTPDGTQQYKPNGWGLFDMHGNVAEWTRSDFDATRKAVRGGSWRDRPERATASFEIGYLPWQKVFNVGFRVLIEE
ncbi:MAG TPA: formylglycine-generating enzyme family protein, partial [Tichowtungia sp.]|nr:formylglycine-generating enzyme family protein [Tichowtungia sp.]